MRFLKLCGYTLLLVSASCAPEPSKYAPSATVTPRESLSIASAYRLHQWQGGKRNIKHGKDSKGIRVDTPDESLKKGRAPRPGWWSESKVNVGVPYKWGGFDTPESFDAKLKAGYYAGDVYTSEKRRLLYKAVSEQACGIDCSGFVSRCWKLNRAYSSRELPSLCHQLDSFSDLQPGDLINKKNVHSLLFVKFANEEKTEFTAYETGSAPSWKVLYFKVSLPYLQRNGYLPYRYKNMVTTR